MKSRIIFPVFSALLLVAAAGFGRAQAAPAREEPAVRRYALMIGANNGGPGRTTLRYAVKDARAFGDVLLELGGVLPEDAVFLEQPDRDAVFREIRSLSDKVDRARPRLRRLEVLFYYSGHSDEENILLGREKISYPELRTAINDLKADVRIAVLDSCASGAFTASKGVIKRSPFLLDEAYDMKGYAFLTSSSADETAQESRRLQGSFFTRNLVSALRGAADRNSDGRITLTEAYLFAFEETLAQTEKTAGGPQHPNYHIEMSGRGDVIITDINQSGTLLTLKGDIGGRFFIHNRSNVLVGELGKPEGKEIAIGLEEGFYRLTAVSDHSVFEAAVLLAKGEPQSVGRSRFERVDRIPTRARGDRNFIPSFGPRGTPKWQVEIFGGLAQTEPDDLNFRAELDQMGIDSVHDKYSYLRRTGEISFYQADLGERLQPLRFSFDGGIRLRRSINSWLSVSLDLSLLTGTSRSTSFNNFTVIETSGWQYIDKHSIDEFVLSAQAWIPGISLHAGFALFRTARLEARIGAGPVFASCRYRSDGTQIPMSDSGQVLEEPYFGILEERGRGVGFSIDGGLRLLLAVAPRWGLSIEAGYAHRIVSRLSGSGLADNSTEDRTWDGEWAMKYYIRLRPWGEYIIDFPSNYWPEELLPMRVRDFNLDLSGVQIKLGLTFRL